MCVWTRTEYRSDIFCVMYVEAGTKETRPDLIYSAAAPPRSPSRPHHVRRYAPS